jgi:hypothetical protein
MSAGKMCLLKIYTKMIPNYPDFVALNLSHYQELLEFQLKTNTSNCEINVANIYIWQDFYKPTLTKINNNLCIKITPFAEESYFIEPLGDNKIDETLQICLADTKKMSLLSESYINKITKTSLPIKNQIEHADYLYLTNDLSTFPGRKFDAKRNQINKFKRIYSNYQYEPVSIADSQNALSAFVEWYEGKDNFSNYEMQKTALEKSFTLFNSLNLFGSTIKLHNKLLGFSVMSKLSKEMVDLHFLYAAPIPGLFQTLLNETCLNLPTNYKFINLEQDLGIEGIKKSKLSYHPLKLENKFEIKI